MSWFTRDTDPRLFACACGRETCDAPGPSADLLHRLDQLREVVGRAILVTSGPRCRWHTAQPGVKGAVDSDHLTGDGADLLCRDSKSRFDLLQANFAGGGPIFTRLGIGADFVHVGVVAGKSQQVVWTYYVKGA